MVKGFARDESVKTSDTQSQPQYEDLSGDIATLTPTGPGGHYEAADVGSGRAVKYEWEDIIVDVLDRVAGLESGGGGGGTGASYVFNQNVATATWTINHNLGTKPSVVIVDGSGHRMYVETIYASDNQLSLIFAMPTTGTAYLHG